MNKVKTPRSLVVECPPSSGQLGRKKPIPKITIDLEEGAATLVRCPFPNVDIEIRDYDVPEDWEVTNTVSSELETGIDTDPFGRRYQYVKFKKRK